MGTSERQLFRARIAWLCKWLLSHVCGGGLLPVNLVCLPAKKEKKRKYQSPGPQRSHSAVLASYLLFFRSTSQNEFQNGVICIADLEILKDHPCDLSSCERAFFLLCSFSLNEDSSFEVSVDDLLETLAVLEPRTSKFGCNLSLVIEYAVFRSARDFANSISLIHTIASFGRLAHEDTSLLKTIRHILKFLTASQASNSSFSASVFWKVLSLSPLVLVLSQEDFFF